MISCCVLLANAAFLMQFIKESQVRVRQARFRTGFPENTTIFCNFSLVFSEQDKLACVHLTVTLTHLAISPSIPVQQDIIHPNICLNTAKPIGLWTRLRSCIMPSCPAFHIKGSALCVGFIQLSPTCAQSHLRSWDDLNAACETSLHMGPSVPRGAGHWSLDPGSCICTSWICIDVSPCNSFHLLLGWARGTAGPTEHPLPGILCCMKLWSRRGCAEQCGKVGWSRAVQAKGSS